jgi:enamine deaminase RidA (YjgF/YER057c/UK114 family)
VTDGWSQRRTFSSGGPWEDRYGDARAVRFGDRIVVSGCTGVVDGVLADTHDAAAQADRALRTAAAALEALGGDVADVIRTRMYVVHRSDCDAVGDVHGRWFGRVRPAATMVVVAGLIDAAMLVEIEVEAHVGSGSGSAT